MRFGTLAVAVPFVLTASSSTTAQTAPSDSPHVGDRVRVHIAATHDNPNVFVGNLAQLTSDTLTLVIPGQKGRVVLARASIADIAVSSGRESRLTTVGRVLPFALPVIVSTAFLASITPSNGGPHHVALRNQRYALLGMQALLLGRMFSRAPRERWKDVTDW